jgi:hypothetical protein
MSHKLRLSLQAQQEATNATTLVDASAAGWGSALCETDIVTALFVLFDDHFWEDCT